MRNWTTKWIVVGGLLAAAASSAQNGPRGGEVPTPFENANLKVELASGEYYVLCGKIRWTGYTAYLEVNFEEHPWLKSDYRTKNPFYPLILSDELNSMSIEFLESFKDQSVKIKVQAKNKGGKLYLELHEKPKLRYKVKSKLRP